MRFIVSRWIGCLLLVCVAAGPATRPGLSEREAALLAQLQSPDWRQRALASETLDDLVDHGQEGQAAVSAMIAQVGSAEARTRLQSVMERVRLFKHIGPTLITLHVKDAAPQRVFAELFRQVGAPMITDPPTMFDNLPAGRLSVDIDGKPFWEVFPQLAAQADLTLAIDETRYRLTRGAFPNGPRIVCGPIVVVAMMMDYQRGIGLSSDTIASSESFSLQMRAYCEPHLRVLRMTPIVNISRAIDDRGNSLIPNGTPNDGAVDEHESHEWDLYAELKYPKTNAGTKLAEFRANATFTVVSDQKTVEVTDLMHAKPRVLDSALRLSFRSCQKSDGEYQITFQTDESGMQTLRDRKEDSPHDIHVYDAHHNELKCTQTGNGMSGDQILITANFTARRDDAGQTGPPDRMTWMMTSQTRDMVVPIEFKDLPMDGIGSR